MSDSKVEIQIPEQMINSLVQAEIVRALGDKDKLVEGVVRAALKAEDRSCYGRKTLFEGQVEKMIRETAVECFGEWLTSNKERVRKALLSELTKQQGKRIKGLVDGLVENMGERFFTSVTLNLKGA